MARWSILALLLAGCSAGPESDLQYIKQARSIAAEWAMVNDQAAQGKLTRPYVSSMRRWLHDDLQSSAKSLSEPNSDYGRAVHALLQEPGTSSPARLRAYSNRLKQIEDRLESA